MHLFVFVSNAKGLFNLFKSFQLTGRREIGNCLDLFSIFQVSAFRSNYLASPLMSINLLLDKNAEEIDATYLFLCEVHAVIELVDELAPYCTDLTLRPTT